MFRPLARACIFVHVADNASDDSPDGGPASVRHIFNLGHGVHPDSDPTALQAVVDTVHEQTQVS